MRGHAARLDLEADEATMRDGNAQLGRLGDERSVCGDALEHRFCTDGRELLVRYCSENEVAAQRRRFGRCQHQRGNGALHVVRAAAVEAPALDPRLERRLHPGDADRVKVPVQEQ